MTVTKLYRFQPVPCSEDDRLATLERGKVFFSDPAKFNDPFDLKPDIRDLTEDRWCDAPAFKTAMRKALACLLDNPDMYKGAFFLDSALADEFQAWAGEDFGCELDWDTRLRTAIEARIAHFGVVCLTPQWDSRLMWAHYANNGKGFCIEYEVNWLCQTTELRFVPVVYSSETPVLCMTEAMFTPHQFLYRALATKHADWAYEKEIRLVCLNSKGKNVEVNSNFVRITGLIAGYAMQESMQSDLKQTAERLGVEAMKMTNHHTGGFSKELLI